MDTRRATGKDIIDAVKHHIKRREGDLRKADPSEPMAISRRVALTRLVGVLDTLKEIFAEDGDHGRR